MRDIMHLRHDARCSQPTDHIKLTFGQVAGLAVLSAAWECEHMGGRWTPPASTEAIVITIGLVAVVVLTPLIAVMALVVALPQLLLWCVGKLRYVE
jgi:hypothetical protein